MIKFFGISFLAFGFWLLIFVSGFFYYVYFYSDCKSQASDLGFRFDNRPEEEEKSAVGKIVGMQFSLEKKTFPDLSKQSFMKCT